MEIPRLMGPALLTLAFYLWDAFHAASPARRRDARWIWQTALLGGLGILVVAWNLLLGHERAAACHAPAGHEAAPDRVPGDPGV